MDTDEVYSYFWLTLGRTDLIVKMLRRLGVMYMEQGKFEQAIQTYRKLITEDNTASNVEYYEQQIQKANKYLGR